MLRILVEPLAAEEILFRGIDAHELDVRTITEPVEQPRTEGRPTRGLLRLDALAQVKVVFDLCAIVALLGLIRIVIADRRIHRNAVDDVAIRLEVREEPVIVFVAGVPRDQTEDAAAGVDVVAGREQQPHILRLDDAAESVANLELPAIRRMMPDADPEIAD